MQHLRSRLPDPTPILPGTMMFADLIQRLRDAGDLSETRKRDLISGLNRVASALGIPAEDIPCDPIWLQPRLIKVSPAAIGVTQKAWQNARSDARMALVWAGIVSRRNSRKDLSPEWSLLWNRILSMKEKTLRAALCRFVYFMNNEGILPGEVRDDHMDAYRNHVICNEISKSPSVAFIAALDGWNLATRRVEGWPPIVLTRPSRRKRIKLPLSDFPASFEIALDQLAARLQSPDPFSDEGQTAPLRAATIRQYRVQLQRFASELVEAGTAIEQIVDLAVLIDPAIAESGLRHMLARNDNQTSKGIYQAAALLRNLGRKLGAPQDHQERLTRLASRVMPKTSGGMTTKNRTRLRVLQDDRKQHVLLCLPEVLNKQAAKMPKAFHRFLLQEDALAIAILLVCPLRIKNVAGLHLDRNLHRPGDGRAFLSFEEDETKTGRPIEFEVPPDVLKMIDRHLAQRSPHLCPAGTRWLFPRRDGAGPVDPNQLSSRLSRRIHRETGLEMNAHLFRHFAVMLWLDANPGAYEVARRLLGHSEVSHTINMYSGLEGRAAVRAFSDLVSQQKKKARG